MRTNLGSWRMFGLAAVVAAAAGCSGSSDSLDSGSIAGTAGVGGAAGTAGSSSGSSGSTTGGSAGSTAGDAGSAGSSAGGSGGAAGSAGSGGSGATGGSGGSSGSAGSAGSGGTGATAGAGGTGATAGAGGTGATAGAGGTGATGGTAGTTAGSSGSSGSAGTSAGSAGSAGSSGSAGAGTGGVGAGGNPAGPLGGPGAGGSSGSAGSAGSSACTNTDPNTDGDGDGYTPAQGDCNDCDPLVNPGAIDVVNYDANNVPFPDSEQIDDDCDGTPVLSATPTTCDTGIALNNTNAESGAKAIDICTKVTPGGVQYGLISAAYVHSNGSAFATPGPQVGIESTWGPNVPPKLGANMLALSSGHARTPGQANACTGSPQSCNATSGATPPPGFPQDPPNCPASNSINDDVALELHLKAPTNATGFKFKFKFYSFEYAEWVCNNFNDQFIALMNPAPQGSLNGNISFDANNNPVSVNIAFFDVCNAANIGDFAQNCNNGGGTTCPTAPSPYCPNGTTELQGTGFENDGATSWLQTTAPVTPGQEFTLRLAIWDTGDSAYDSTVLIDDFEWIATGSVNVGTVSCTSGGTGSCNTCFYQNVQSTGCCGNEFSACHNDGQCENIYTCLSFCNGNAACEAQCPNDFPAGVPLYNAVTHCLYGDPAVQGSVGACGAVCQ